MSRNVEIALLANPGQCKVTLQAWPWNSITHDRPAPKKGKNPTNSVNTFFIIIYLFSGKPSSGRMFGSLMALQHLRKRLNYPVFATEISQFPAAVGLASSPSRWCCDPSPAQIIPPFWASNLQPGCDSGQAHSAPGKLELWVHSELHWGECHWV